ncbi:ATP-dependent RNA helicase SUPV3L1/SUV3 [Kaistia soli DSM 19436]|uniref:ATP-dependent RNA helicase SUPV3L1/SUV3 n=2 Tax=Kaistia TaxID=166953 RepID=A0A1M5CDZ8_9HYPH|nr:ATP-dependent RNA helicase SUPV3L1/SUV3 [Kaistia soli DSM 19436]
MRVSDSGWLCSQDVPISGLGVLCKGVPARKIRRGETTHAMTDSNRPPGAGAGAGGRGVTAVLGPTNTGKTHFAIERMLAHSSGVIGLPLRLLAREVYGRVAARVGTEAVALITGEEKIIPAHPRYRVCTVEALPSQTDASFLAIDEIQLAGDLERGHVFTDRILNLRGRDETLLLGAGTMRGIIEKLLPGVTIITRPRMSMLTYAGSKKITRLPRRSAIVAFSSDEVYAVAELIRRQRGGAAVVLGSLSPRTRNAQVELFQSGDVEFLVATDAIGMGLNLDVDHVAFAQERKFDGYQYRRLSASEFGQIAGRAGRHTRDGTFGVTGQVDPLDDDLVEALENHHFQSVRTLQWRNRTLDFRSLETLRASLDRAPGIEGLSKAPPSVDVTVLDRVGRDPEVKDLATSRERVQLLWDICQIPDYRRIAPANHAELVSEIFRFVARDGAIAEDWFDRQCAFADRTDGDIDTLANRIAHIRTWTFAANRSNWLRDPRHWQERTRAIEDRLSDALHERLTQRFVDRRTSVLMKRLRENAMLEAEITTSGDVLVEGQHVGSLQGFRFTPDPKADGPDAKAIAAVAHKALAGELDRRAEKLGRAPNPELVLSVDGTLRWLGAPIAKIVSTDDALKPRLVLLADDGLTGPARERVQDRVDLWLKSHVETLLKPLFDLLAGAELTAAARGIAFRLVEGQGVLDRSELADELKALDQESRAGLRKLGVRFGAYHVYVPALLKPAPSALNALLWALKNQGLDTPGLAELPQLSASGRTTILVDPTFARPLYRVVGYRIAGNRAVRLDILERLADIIRPLIAWKPTSDNLVPPEGAVDGNGFTVTVSMMSLLGCSGEDFAGVLKSLGYRLDRRPAPPKPAAAASEAAPATAVAEAASDGTDAQESPVETDAAPVSDEPVVAEGTEPVEVVAAELETADPVDVEAAGEGEAVASDAVAEAEPVAETDDASGAIAAETEAVTEAVTVAESAAPAEPEMIEIWRPGRFDRRPPREQGERRGGGRHRGEPQAGAEEAPAETREGRRHGRPQQDRPGQGRPPQGGDAKPGRRDERGPRPDRPAPRPHDRPAHADGERPDRRHQDRPDQRKHGGAPQPRREEPRRERPIDPNSPFAALAALKADLEAKKRGS